MTFFSCEKDSTGPKYPDEVTDIEGNVYQTVKIGNQLWMKENLKVTHYQNGESISQVPDREKWSKLTSGAYCNYNNADSNAKKYGQLYNWYAVTDLRRIAPEGWHVPTDIEWKELKDFIGDSVGIKLKSTCGWCSNGNGLDIYGFNALPAGYRYDSGNFYGYGGHACFWSASDSNNYKAWYRGIFYTSTGIYRYADDKHDGFSVRCIRD
jgi:uncharacterized protein (TIGR02145 family)